MEGEKKEEEMKKAEIVVEMEEEKTTWKRKKETKQRKKKTLRETINQTTVSTRKEMRASWEIRKMLLCGLRPRVQGKEWPPCR